MGWILGGNQGVRVTVNYPLIQFNDTHTLTFFLLALLKAGEKFLSM